MKRNILIIEDNKSHIEALCKIIFSMPVDVEIFTAINVAEGYKYALDYNIHIFLVDIILEPKKTNDVSGLEFVEKIREIRRYEFAPVVFISSLEEPKLFAYDELHCYQYIEKPFEPNKVKNCISKLLTYHVQTDTLRNLVFRIDGVTYFIRYKDIILVEGRRRKVNIYATNEVIEVPNKTFTEILKELNTNLFIQCSRATLINKLYIKQVDKGNRYVKLRGLDKTIEVSALYLNSILQEMNYECDS